MAQEFPEVTTLRGMETTGLYARSGWLAQVRAAGGDERAELRRMYPNVHDDDIRHAMTQMDRARSAAREMVRRWGMSPGQIAGEIESIFRDTGVRPGSLPQIDIPGERAGHHGTSYVFRGRVYITSGHTDRDGNFVEEHTHYRQVTIPVSSLYSEEEIKRAARALAINSITTGSPREAQGNSFDPSGGEIEIQGVWRR